MFAIKDSKQRPALRTDIRSDTVNASTVRIHLPVLATMLLGVLAVCMMLTSRPVTAAGIEVPLKSIAQITFDDDGRLLKYPAVVFFDPVMEEIYLVNGGTSRVVVYGPDFFPRVSIGIGRGVIAPMGGFVMSNGDVYICQASNYRNARRRITILNGAFFVDREIFLDEIPEAEDFKPLQLAISRDGLIYLAGNNNRGVLVLDNEGNFLRRLQPMDEIILRTDEEVEKQLKEEEKLTEQGQQFPEETEEMAPEEDMYAHLPEEFRPRSQDSSTSSWEGIGPVKIIHVAIDSKGNLYLLSLETGKIYVYGPDESFLFAFGQKGGSPGQLSQPRSLAIDEEAGLIYVSDYMRHTILVYDMTGKYLFEFGGRGFGPGWFQYPNSVAINNHGQLIVADLYNKRVQVLEVGYEEMLTYLGQFSTESARESSDAGESTAQDELEPGQPEALNNLEKEPEISLEEMAAQIKEEIIQADELPEEPLPVTSGRDEEGPVQDEPVPEKAEEPDAEKTIPAVELPGQQETTAESPDLDAIDGFVDSWASAWEQQDIEAYLSRYSINFITPEEMSLVDWEKQRHRSLGRPKFIKLDIRDMQKEKIDDTHALVTFTQEYQSDTYSDRVVKTMELIWENGEWKIVKEESSAPQ